MSEGFTTAEDLAGHGRDYVKVGASEIQRIVTLQTSGSTGAGKESSTPAFHSSCPPCIPYCKPMALVVN